MADALLENMSLLTREKQELSKLATTVKYFPMTALFIWARLEAGHTHLPRAEEPKHPLLLKGVSTLWQRLLVALLGTVFPWARPSATLLLSAFRPQFYEQLHMNE